jgi:excisionase family DNA binding protein
MTTLISTKQAAQVLRVDNRTVLRWIHSGVLPARRLKERGKFFIVLEEVADRLRPVKPENGVQQ